MSYVALEACEIADKRLRKHKENGDEMYKFGIGDRVRLISDQELNGMNGSVRSYMSLTNRYMVDVEGQEDCMSVKPVDMELIINGDRNNASESNPSDVIRNHFFLPGMVYEGTIQIPGEAGYVGEQYQNTRQTYKLTIVDHIFLHEVDNDGVVSMSKTPQVLARHRAYEDEQFVTIQIINPIDVNTTFEIEYKDGETTCHGTWNVSRGCIEGTVRQTVNSVDQIYHKSDPVVHTFDLLPFTAVDMLGTSVVVSKARRIAAVASASVDCMRAVYKLFTAFPQESGREKERLSMLSWEDMFLTSVHEMERACALLRHKANVLDVLTFSVPSQRSQCLKELADVAGYDRANAHAQIDTAYNSVRYIASLWMFIEPEIAGPSRDVRVAEYVARNRLNASYETFSNALARAECRLTKLTWNSFRMERPNTEGVESNCCAICMIAIDEDAESAIENGGSGKEILDSGEDGQISLSLRLPCSHVFHEECIQQWLHNNSNCPICRTTLNEDVHERHIACNDDEKELAKST